MEVCIFCKIANDVHHPLKFWENQDFVAILDINPNVEGMTLVIPKKHFQSYVFDLANEVYISFILAAKEVAKILDNKLNVYRTSMVIEGTGVNHAHIKLYPMHGMKSKDEKYLVEERIFFDKYPGYITTLLGPQRSIELLKETKYKITSDN